MFYCAITSLHYKCHVQVVQRVVKRPAILRFKFFLQLYAYGLTTNACTNWTYIKEETSEILHLDYGFVWC